MKRHLLAGILAFCPTAWAQQDEMHPISPRVSYTAEGFTNGSQAAYLGSLSAALDFDLQRLHLGRGTLFAEAQQLHGRGIGASLGVIQSPSNLEAESAARIGEIWYGDQYFAGKLRIKAGRHYADSEFGALDSAGDFLNGAYGAIPTAPMPAYPTPEFGVTLRAAASERLSAAAGVYRGGFAVAEGRFASRRTNCRVGGWRHSIGSGIYAVAEHRFGEADGAPAVFARWGQATGSRNPVANYTGAGVAFRAGGIGVTTIHPAIGRRETVCEAFYKWRATRKIFLQPDLQWIANAGGTAAHHLVGGVRLGVEW